MVIAIAVGLAIYLPMIVEARRARGNERIQRARGGIEPEDDVYSVMRFAYPLGFAAMLVELAFRGRPATGVLVDGAVVFGCAKSLKWWAIAVLGSAWTFRVVAVPGTRLITAGPYRFLRHPNYVAVAGEFVAAMLMTGAVVTGPTATLFFGVLLWKRTRAEDALLARIAPASDELRPPALQRMRGL